MRLGGDQPNVTRLACSLTRKRRSFDGSIVVEQVHGITIAVRLLTTVVQGADI